MEALASIKSLADEAGEQAARAADRAGVVIHEEKTIEGIAQIPEFMGRIWGRVGAVGLGAETLRAMSHAGNYIAVARRDGEQVGGLIGLLALEDGFLHLHSHILGVIGGSRAAGVGFALKQHQRAWALQRGLTKVVWTTDPTVRANAFFNLTKLGANLDEYLVDFYGPMSDAINAGASDRILVGWQLDSERAVRAAGGVVDEPVVESLRASGAAVWLEENEAGDPVISTDSAEVVLCQVPADIVVLRQKDPDLALKWRLAVRDVLSTAMHRGYQTEGVTRSGWFVLRKPK